MCFERLKTASNFNPAASLLFTHGSHNFNEWLPGKWDANLLSRLWNVVSIYTTGLESHLIGLLELSKN